MLNLFQTLLADQAGFVVSSELVLVSSIGVMGMTAGLSEMSNNVNGELRDVGSSIRHVHQGYSNGNSSFTDIGQ